MKKIITVFGAISVLAFGASCNSLDTGASLPIPFTDPAARVSLDIKATPLPPKLCVGLDIK